MLLTSSISPGSPTTTSSVLDIAVDTRTRTLPTRLLLLGASVEVLSAADRVVAGALHRFVFRVGEEGEVRYALGGSEVPHTLGTGFLELIAGDWSVSSQGMTVMKDGRTRTLSVEGPDSRPWIAASLGPAWPPDSGDGRTEKFVLATGFGGFATLPSETAAALHLERWEIPGVARIDGIFQRGACRRARVRARIAAAELDDVIPVAIWPSK